MCYKWARHWDPISDKFWFKQLICFASENLGFFKMTMENELIVTIKSDSTDETYRTGSLLPLTQGIHFKCMDPFIKHFNKTIAKNPNLSLGPLHFCLQLSPFFLSLFKTSSHTNWLCRTHGYLSDLILTFKMAPSII